MQAQEGARPLYSNGEAITAINRREPFANKTGSFIGWRIEFRDVLAEVSDTGTMLLLAEREGGQGRLEIGALPKVYAEELCKAFAASAAVYVVYSYGTVIGWGTSANEYTPEDQVIIPNVRYSATTSRHQHVLEEAAGAKWLQLDGAPAHVSVEERARSYTPRR
ncbi:hypothetical protein SEA_REYNAULD_91 [Rhodococcus phage Reynauld]|uniref:Uncharacterized protein n=1 Tax=Rhodococcus phage Reynauld TaxID=3062845 RepID=A0ACD4UHN0_9CAUD|nr:hypothetical protein SEA_REYNAULD_91 [Rhodococcus phage Reynauld]